MTQLVSGVRALLMGADGGAIAGNDLQVDGGVTASYWYGQRAPDQEERASWGALPPFGHISCAICVSTATR